MHIIKTPACHTHQVIKIPELIDNLICKGLFPLILVKTEFAIIDISIHHHHICNHRHHRLLKTMNTTFISCNCTTPVTIGHHPLCKRTQAPEQSNGPPQEWEDKERTKKSPSFVPLQFLMESNLL